MAGKRRFGGAAALAIILLAAIALVPPASSAGSKKVYWVDLAYQIQQKPDFVYFTANSGGQMKNIRWKNWGGRKAIGRGWFLDTQPNPIAEKRKGPARLIARKPVRCTLDFGSNAGKRIWTYRHIKLIYPNGNGGMRGADVSDRGGCR